MTEPTEETPTTPTTPAREVWRELASQREILRSTAERTTETHAAVIAMATDMHALRDETRRTAEHTARLVGYAERADSRAQREEDARTRAAEREEARRDDARAARATIAARVAGNLTDWWVEHWRTILIILAILLGVNVSPLLVVLGLAPAHPAALTAAPIDETPTTPLATPLLDEAPTTPLATPFLDETSTTPLE